jgi:uncharacterized protein YjbJ (UPF0337 family)
MDPNRIDGLGHQIKGAVKAGLGRIIGDAKLESAGIAEQASGKAQSDIGGAKDAETGIDRDRVKGIGHQFRGAVKEGFGKIVGDPMIEADGAAERAAGKAQNAIGSAREEARDARAKNAEAAREHDDPTDKPPTP